MTQKPIGVGDSNLPTIAKPGERYVMRLAPAGRYMSQEHRDHEGCVVTILAQKYWRQPVMVRADDGWVGHAYDDELFPFACNAGAPEPKVDSYDAIWNALHRIDTAAASLPTYEVLHEGGIEAFTQNVVEAVTKAAEEISAGRGAEERANLALQACRALELAYARGAVRDRGIEWSDLDEARALARKALGPQECAVIDESAQREVA